ncbi:protein IQ-DOMAIN 1 isoform X1 [Cucumis melo var. makuwa]|uniref:Protein IQ-DOMAIN 1 isoform X1 n=1 Tax=Cucumis melo var. makuwa TaxID=1194695 RepID=A0A5D3E0E6_CUCMM|nr:protein IQ-DOMAIN 1 isoform X1 [Cucumis melo var. makuwa]
MGKKGTGWFSTVKKVFKSNNNTPSKDYSPHSLLNKKESANVEKWQHNAPDVISFEQFPIENSTEITNDERVQSTPRIEVRLAGYGWQSREDRAATLIQAYYRGYLVSSTSSSCFKGAGKIASIGPRPQCSKASTNDNALHASFGAGASKKKIKENSSRKRDALMKRERALAYAYSYQQQHQRRQDEERILQLGEDVNDLGFRHDKGEYGWNWLEHWMSSQPYNNVRQSTTRESYITPTTATTATDDMSEKTVEMDPIALARLNLDPIDIGRSVSGPYSSRQPISKNIPSYMASTQSAKAKVRNQGMVKHQGPNWNKSMRRRSVFGSGCDSSSSGGGTMTYQGQRSPILMNNGPRLSPIHIMGCGPDYPGGEDWALPPLGVNSWRAGFA